MKPRPARVSLALSAFAAAALLIAACGDDAGPLPPAPMPLARHIQALLDDPTPLPRAVSQIEAPVAPVGEAGPSDDLAAAPPADAGRASEDPAGDADEGEPGTAGPDGPQPAAGAPTAEGAAGSPPDQPQAQGGSPTEAPTQASPPEEPAAPGARAPSGSAGSDAPARAQAASVRPTPKPKAAARVATPKREPVASSASVSLGKAPPPALAPPSVNTDGLGATDLFYQGKDQLRAGNPQAAIVSLSASQRLRPSGRTLALLGQAYFDASNFKSAEQTLRAAGTNPDAMLLLATLYQQLGKTANTRKVYTAFLATHPQHPRAAWVRQILKTL